jgi:hypothetical protein
MRRPHRDKDEQGLAEERRRLIHRYMAEAGRPTTLPMPQEELRREELPAPASAVFEEPEPQPAGTPAGAPELDEEPDDRDHGSGAVLQLLPAARPHVDVDGARRTLEEVLRLCEHMEWLAGEAGRRSTGLAAAVPQRGTSAPAEVGSD